MESESYNNFIEIKQEEVDPIYNQPVIVQNAVFIPEISQHPTIKSEPEENYFMDIKDQSFTETEIIQDETSKNSQSSLKISLVTQGFHADEIVSSNVSKRGKKSKKVEDLKVTTKMKPTKNAKKVQKAVKNATKLDKNLNKLPKSRKKVENKIEDFEDQIDNFGLSSKNFEENVGIFGENDEVVKLKPTKTPKFARKSNIKPKMPSKSASTSIKPNQTSIAPKIIQIYGTTVEQDLNVDNSKISIQKSKTSPSKATKNVKQKKIQQNSSEIFIKSEPSTQNLQSSFILDKNNTKQLKLKISRPQKHSESTKDPKKLNPYNNQPENPTNLKQEPLTFPIFKPEPEFPLHLLPDDNDLQLVDYEPKITKKRKEIRLECDNCDKVFKSKYSIIWHMKEHMLTMPFNCKICGKGFSYERSFRQHELTHAAKIKCEICGKSLKPHAMYYHMKYRHTDEKTHQCPLCPKAFKTKDNITRHMMRHNMEFPCSICGRKFAENSRLQMHLNMHQNPEAFFCSICNKSFEHIDRHMKRLHAKKRERNLKCQYCEYASDSKQTLRRHEEMHEKRNEILQSKTRKRKIKLKIIEMETFECKVCNVVLQTKSGYKSHLRHYHKGKDQVKADIANEIKDESSMESENFVEVKVEKEEISVIQ